MITSSTLNRIFPPSQHRALLQKLVFSVILLIALPCSAEICWNYTDTQNAKVPLKCVEMGDGTTPCSWRPDCNTDSNPSDCCMAIPDPTATQTIGEMHVAWHACLGNVGTSSSPPPPNRGLRWFAFHRQLESDFNVYREGLGIDKIDSLEWCPGMNMPYGHFGGGLSLGDHPLNCGIGISRPNDIICDGCEAFSECLFVSGAGPTSCTATPGCSISGGVSFPYTELQDFKNADEIATLLDDYFHGDMHGAVGDADGGGYVADCPDPNCSTRDGMFWRLHKSLDDVIRAWQDMQAVDVTLLIDRSGSMSGASGTGSGTRLDNAVEAADMFADLLEEGRSDGAVNRVGIVSYSSNASNASLNMPLQDVDINLRNPGGAFATTLAALNPNGSTSIGAGIEATVSQLCPGGSCATHVPAVGENERKAVLLLTDGKENRAPCLQAGCQGGTGAEIDYASLDVMQLCAVGLGNAASINGELLTILAERQGGIYLNNTDGTGSDLKDFFAKCFAQLTDEFIGLDPSGMLAANETTGPLVPYESCDDSRITFTSGWNRTDLPGDHLQLLVTSPNGDAWVPTAAAGEMSTEDSWAFKRSTMPYRGQAQGVWNMQLLRPQSAFANGFTTDSFVDHKQGVRIVRREIQRLCPITDEGKLSCGHVLYFEDGNKGRSVYEGALKAETGMTIGDLKTTTNAGDFEKLLNISWDLIVYARQAGADIDEAYDKPLASLICKGTRAIVTDTRTGRGGSSILGCAGAVRDSKRLNLEYLVGGNRFIEEKAKLYNPGYKIFSYELKAKARKPQVASQVAKFRDARTLSRLSNSAAIVSKALPGSDLNWHKNVLVTGLSQLTAFAPRTVPQTGEPLMAAVRILPSFKRAGGYPNARMTVEVERPTRGLGEIIKRSDNVKPVKEDPVSSVELQLDKVKIPTVREIYELNDYGENGDRHAFNGTYSAELPINAAVDGMYTFHYRFEYPLGSCTARRELKQSLFVSVNVSPSHSDLKVSGPSTVPGGKVYSVQIRPQDALGNVIGPGRPPRPSCEKPCKCDPAKVTDENNGVYAMSLEVPDSVTLSTCSIDAYGVRFIPGKRPVYEWRKQDRNVKKP